MGSILSKKKGGIVMSKIVMKKIGKTYDGKIQAVTDFNLEIQDKEFVILVGPSGCGKSTALRMIAGLEEITEGELWIGGKKVNTMEPKDRDIAMVFQNYALYPHMTVFENMAFGLKMKKKPKAEIKRKVEEVAQKLELVPYLSRKPKALSGGQKQRVALGRAMVREPAVFLLDEPLSNLDAKLRTQMRREISEIHQKLEATFVYVTHDQVEAMTMADRIVVMKDGYIQQTDTPQKIYDMPRNLFVAEFIGAPPMNRIMGRIEKKENQWFVIFLGIELKLTPEQQRKCDQMGQNNQKVWVGIRPEHLKMENKESPNLIVTKINYIEVLGSEICLSLFCRGEKLTAKLPYRIQALQGEKYIFSVEAEKIQIFHLDTEESFFYEKEEN